MTLDKFRLLASILIVAIHTYPLSTINENLDFVFTHIFCRIGVPIFLMITGYFILPKAIQDKKSLMKYTKKIAKIYLLCMILYLPVNIYAGKLKGINFIGILKSIFIDGTFYHLWYFPALILGIWITYFVIKHIKNKNGLILVSILYVIGLFGDSYFGIAEKWSVTKTFYDAIFNIFDYTRNGLFYVPIFLYLGFIMKNINWKISKRDNIIFILVSLVLMILEGIILHHFNLQRHDSMYFMLIPTMIGIFNFILQNKNENNKYLRNIATTIYIIHPMFIIVVRGIAKIIQMQNLMIDNSIIHYLLVVISSLIFSIILEKLKKKRSEKNGKRFKTKQSMD